MNPLTPRDSDSHDFQTAAHLRALLAQAGASPKKRFGQHFLIDRNLMHKLLDSADLTPHDTVLEVGPGTGSLTTLLCQSAGHVVCVEIDPEMAEIAANSLRHATNLTLLRTDILAKKSAISPEVITTLQQTAQRIGGNLKLVANLPYDVATPLVINLLLSDLKYSRLCFSVQAEVADRFLAHADTDDYGPVAIISQSLADCRRICKVPPQAFWPQPKVDSAMLRLDPFPQDQRPVRDPRAFADFVRSFFLHRRKTMQHLANKRADADRILDSLNSSGISVTSRPEQLTVPQWIALFVAIS